MILRDIFLISLDILVFCIRITLTEPFKGTISFGVHLFYVHFIIIFNAKSEGKELSAINFRAILEA